MSTEDRTGAVTVVFFWLVITAVTVGLTADQPLAGWMHGPDSFARMQRVLDFLQTGAWFDNRLADVGFEQEIELHWTRPFDIVMAALALPMVPFAGLHDAVFLAGLVISPVIMLAAGLAFFWCLRPLAPQRARILASIAFFFQAPVWGYGNIGRADHHLLLVLAFTVGFGFLLRALADDRRHGAALWLGVSCGLGLWLSVELMLLLLPAAALLSIAWAADNRRLTQNRLFGAGLALTTSAAFFIDTAPAAYFEAAYDRISIVYVALAVCIFAIWQVLGRLDRRQAVFRRTRGRIAGLAVACAFGAVLFAVLFPAFFGGPMAEVDRTADAIWQASVAELRSVVPRSAKSAGEFIMFVGPGLFAVPYAAWLLGARRDFPPRLINFALFSMAAATFLIGLFFARFALYTVVVSFSVIAVAMTDLFERINRSGGEIRQMLVRVAVSAAVIAGPFLAGVTVQLSAREEAAGDKAEACPLHALGAHLDTVFAEPLTILTHVDHGPEIAFRTRHKTLAGPYHRNGDAIIRLHEMLSGPAGPGRRAAFVAAGVDLVLICPAGNEKTFFNGRDESSLYFALAQDRPPAWLTPLALPQDLSDFRLFAFSERARRDNGFASPLAPEGTRF